jgi:hypothetical protein
MRGLLIASLIALALLPTLRAQGTEIGFIEDFALAESRAAVLDRLVPGTEDYYYYRALERQHAGDLDAVDGIMRNWRKRHRQGDRYHRLEDRQAMLRYAQAPKETWNYLRKRLDLDFKVEAPRRADERRLPSRLDPEVLDLNRLLNTAMTDLRGRLKGIEDLALPLLASRDLSLSALRELLSRLDRPDIPGLAELVVKELADEQGSRGFGSLKVHRYLLREQLDLCAQLRPALLADAKFVDQYLTQLAPPPTVNLDLDAEARLAYLNRLEAFASRLPAVHNSLKAHVLHHRLRHDVAQRAIDADRLRRYLRLPRRSGWTRMREFEGKTLVNTGRRFPTGLAPIGNDAALVRRCLMKVLRGLATPDAWRDIVAGSYLDRAFAEAKILAGQGDPEQWASMINDPALFEAIKDRVEIDFAPGNPQLWAAGDAVALDLDLKNIPTLLVKVFEIDAAAYYAERKREVDATIDLEGVVPSIEYRKEFSFSPFRRHRHRLDLPALSKPGSFVVELIGNGMSSRAVIKKGDLFMREEIGAGGHRLRVYDENQRLMPQASARLEGRSFAADEEGIIRIPFTSRARKTSLILSAGRRAARVSFQHQAERYTLEAGFHLERESLLSGGTARLMMRPTLSLAGKRIPIELLKDPQIEIVATTLNGVTTTLELDQLKLRDDREHGEVIAVPDELSNLQLTLRGRIDSLTQNRPVGLQSATRSIAINGIASSTRIAMPLLTRSPEGYALELRGRNGEPIVRESVRIALRHLYLTDPIKVALETDEAGQVQLGKLENIVSLSVDGYQQSEAGWDLREAEPRWPISWHARRGEIISLPLSPGFELSRRSVSLFEMRDGRIVRDHRSALTHRGAFLEIEELPAGDFVLELHESGRRLNITVIEGEREGEWLVGRTRVLPRTAPARLQINAVESDGENLSITCVNAGAEARIHLIATRYLPAFDAMKALRRTFERELPEMALERLESQFVSGRRISDEYRYILERRLARKFPGNMLSRPGLILNPWALEETNAAIGLGGGAGGAFGGRRGGNKRMRKGRGRREQGKSGDLGSFADLDFLAESSTFVLNLVPDARGRVAIPLTDLGGARMVRVFAVDEDDLCSRRHTISNAAIAKRDLRLQESLDPERRIAERRRIQFLDTGKKTQLELARSSRIEIFDDLASVFRFYRSRIGSADLGEFEPLLDWPEMKEEDRLDFYDEYACHELHVFLFQKDRAFFDAVVRPYLANKRDRDFIDRWLLKEDLRSYLEPWAFAELNIVEKILLLGSSAEGRARIARHVSDIWMLNPEDPNLRDALFAAALERDALSLGDDKFADELRSSLGLRTMTATPHAPKAARMPERSSRIFGSEEAVEEEEEPEAEEMMADSEDGNDFDAKVESDRAIAPKPRANSRQALSERRKAMALFRDPEPTRRYVEHAWWHRRQANAGPEMIAVNAFWRDFAASRGEGNFVSANFALAGNSFAEAMLALAFLDLPFRSGDHGIDRDQRQATISAASPLLLLTKEIRDVELTETAAPLIVSESLYAIDPRNGKPSERPLNLDGGDEILKGVAYLRRVAITNPTPKKRQLDLMTQIPAGSLPLARTRILRGLSLRLEAFGTTTFDDHFYFPAAGSFRAIAAQVSEEGKALATSRPIAYRVLAAPSGIDINSWPSVAREAKLPDLLSFLERANIAKLDLSRIRWRMRDETAFKRVTALLRQRLHFDAELWSFAILHRDEVAAREYLGQEARLANAVGPAFDSPLLSVDAVARGSYELAEFRPIINARAHRFGARPRILDHGFAMQYLAFLEQMAFRSQLGSREHLAAASYLVTQDRIELALEHFAKVQRDQIATKIQYDYLDAYLAFFGDNPERARGIAKNYAQHPVPRWRERFAAVIEQLDEAAGAVVVLEEGEADPGDQGAAAKLDPSLALRVEGDRLLIDHRNLEGCRIAFFEMDVEFLFSSSPFVQNDAGAFAYVTPNLVRDLDLNAEDGKTEVKLPARFANSNVLVEVRAAGLVKRQPIFANAMSIALAENYGQVQVVDRETGRPAKATYVKVFARTDDGKVRFHKDGYTDLRGRFDYASLTGRQEGTPKRFALLILDEERGAEIREVAPPLR